ncbi:MAG: trypsin-like peptidase domain-containing protein [Clostridia bacterium]|nr:trypsin-like peptidase domain-containing protein [Clostridia bacterium]
MKHGKMMLIFVLLLSFGAVSHAQDIRVYVNGLRMEQKVILQDDRTYVPLRAVSEALGAEVVWDEATRSVAITFTEEDAIAGVVENVSPSVVTIVGNYAGTGTAMEFNNPTVHGSGVIYKSNGYILTNAHVVTDVKNLTVILADGTSLPATVLLSDETADLAIVKIDKIGLRAIVMATPESVVAGKTAIAIGTPVSLSMRNTVTRGIVSASGVSVSGSHYKLIQTDAAVNPGNSGGPLLNSKGELIGINSSKFAGSGIDNMAFAIPVDTVNYIISEYENFGKVRRPNAEISFTESWEAKIGLPTKKGITVKSSSHPVLSIGDVVSLVGDMDVHSITDWNEAVKKSFDGKSLTVTFTRNGQTYTEKMICE